MPGSERVPLRRSRARDGLRHGRGYRRRAWETIEHGVTAIAPGQVLIVAPGTYRVAGTGERYAPALNPTSGTAEAPVVIKAGGAVTITSAVIESGTAQGGTPSTIVLADSASSEDQAYTDFFVRISAGTGAGQYRTVLRNFDDFGMTSYEGASRTAWVSLDSDGVGNWETTPDATSEYELTVSGP